MPKYTIQLPDGRTMQAEAPDEAKAMEGAKQWYAANPKKSINNKPRVPQYVTDDSGQEINYAAPEYDEARQRQEALNKQAETAKRRKLESRGFIERALDTAAFAGSMIPRTITRGEYGLGDMLPGRVGEGVARGERDFAEANEDMLETAAGYGSLAMGIPGLNMLGAPARGMTAAMATARMSPRGAMAGAVRGAGEMLETASRSPSAVVGTESAIKLPVAAGRAGRGLQGYADRIQPPISKARQQAVQTGLPENIQTLPERLRDYQAFRELEMRPFGPSLGSQPTARFSRTVEEIPVVGGVVRSPKQMAELEAKAAQEGLARSLQAPATEEAAGGLVQRALERYRGAGMTDIEPGTLRGQPVGSMGPQKALGINPYQPVKASQTLTAGQAANVEAAAPIRAAAQGGTAQTARGATVPAARPLDQIGLRRTNVEDLSKAELRRVIKAPSRETSFATRAEALYEKAWKTIPKGMRTDESVNSNQIGWKNLQDTMRGIQRETANQISGQGTLGGDLAKRITTARSHTNLAELRSIRTEIGRSLSNFGQFETRLDRAQLKRLYAAASKDMEAGLMDLANRAMIRTKSTGKDKMSIAQAKEADAALYEFRRADRYFRQGQARMDRFMNILEAKTPNEAARKIVTALKEKTANPSMLREVAGVLRPEELNSFRGYVIGQLGTKRPGAKNAESIFNWNNFATDANAILDAPGGKEFLTKGMAPETARRFENLIRVANRMKYYEQTTNYSGSAYSGIGVIALADPMSAVATALGGAAVGKLLTSNAFLAWNEALMKAQLKMGNTAASNARIAAQYAKRLPALARAKKFDPDLQQAFIAFSQAIEDQTGGLEKQKARALLPSPAMR